MNKQAKWRLENWHKELINNTRRKDPEFDLTAADVLGLWDTQKGRCYWTGIALEISPVPMFPFQPSLERLRNHLPHTKDNCVLACWAINSARGKADIKTWIKFLHALNSTLNLTTIERHEMVLRHTGH